MTSEIAVDSGAPHLNLTPEEKRIYGQLFRQADSDNVGVVTGEVAVKFFEKTRLDSRVLGEIWQIADKENRGFLTPAGFGIVLRLIGHAQAAREPSPELALQPGPIPRFDGFTPAPPPAPLSAQATGLSAQPTGVVLPPPPPPGPPGPSGPVPLSAQGSGAGPIRIPPLTPDKVAQYAGLFERQTLVGGNMLPGKQAKQIFEKSGLPNDVLGRIWQLADTEQRGALVQTEFVIAMHLLASMKSGALTGLPAILPAALYEAATRRVAPVGPAGPVGPVGAVAPVGPRQQSPTTAGPGISAIPRQLSGQAQMRTGSPLGRAPTASPTTAGPEWLVTPADKARFDLLFDELDKPKKGFISGEQAVPFLSQSNLPEEALAQIWDLADVNAEGRLTRDTFAVAMYLIRQQRSKRDGPSMLPATLPPNLVPPSMRHLVRPTTATSVPGFEPPPPVPQLPQQQPQPPQQLAAPPQPPVPQPKSALDDLFGLDASPPSSSQPPLTASAPTDPFAGSASPLSPGSPAKPSPTTATFKPFVPSSSFGRTLTAQVTGDSNGSAPSSFPKAPPQSAAVLQQQPQPQQQQDDLLGDNDAEISKKLTNDTTELANLSNQVGSLSKHMQEVQGQRAAIQNELNQAAVQKKNFEQRLAQLRALYEKEAKDVRSLEEQLAASRNDTKKLQTDIALLEGTYQDLQNQHRQVSAALQADTQENANLKEKIRAVNAEIAQLKPQIEKLKSEARQNKGLVAINKKQLATNEAERDRLKTEADELTKTNEELTRQLSASSSVSAAPPAQIASPALSTASGNNPFFRRTGSTDLMGAFSSPTVKALNDKSFDDVFGPTFTPPPAASAPPPVSFKPQNTGTSTGSVGSSSATPATSIAGSAARQPTLPVESQQQQQQQQAAAAAPEQRQTSSAFLPFGDAADSSRRMSPVGQVDTAAHEPVASPLDAAPTGQSMASASESTQGAAIAPTAASPAETKAPAPTNGETGFGAPLSSPADTSAKSGAALGHAHSDSLTDPFSAMDQVKAKEDFELAFASFKTAKAKDPAEAKAEDTSSSSSAAAVATADANKAFAAFHSEFPPISELERDDESDSDSDGGGGFDDDFTPVSPKAVVEKKAEGGAGVGIAKTPSPTLTKAGPAESSSAPAGSAAPDSSAIISSEKAAAPAPAAPHVEDIFGPAVLPAAKVESAPGPSQAMPAAPTASGAFDDLDDDFEGLEDAKEGSADDDFATISRSGLDDFNPVFDSSPPPSHATKSDSNLTGTTAPFGGEGSFDFASLGSTTGGSTIGGSPTMVPHQNGTATPSGVGSTSGGSRAATASDAHDWDAIFASFDESAPGASSTTVATTAAASGVGVDGGSKAAGGAPASSLERPAPPGRALTEGGEHDDPILKNLTTMGYSRADALSALEKYDYNLERAANYLASQS